MIYLCNNHNGCIVGEENLMMVMMMMMVMMVMMKAACDYALHFTKA